MKRSLFILSLLIVTCSLSAQSVLSFGARGGLEFMMPKSDWATMKTKVGYAGIVDIGYTYWGIHTGISAGFAQNECQIDMVEQMSFHDPDGGTPLEYTINGNLSAKLQRAYGEVPVMAAFQRNGLLIRLGMKGQFAFWSRTIQKLNMVDVSAFFPEYGVIVTNGITGHVENNQKMEFDGGAPAFSLWAALHIGYEMKVRKTDRLGVFAYLDYNFWNTGTGTTSSLTSITPPSGSTDADVSVGNALSAVITRINPIQVGVTVYYALELRTYHRHTKSSSIWETSKVKR